MAALNTLGTTGRVLLVDDSPIALEAIGSRLMESGLDVVMSSSPTSKPRSLRRSIRAATRQRSAAPKDSEPVRVPHSSA